MKPSSTDRASLGCALLLALAAALSLALICAGCVYRGAKITEGTDLAVGINVPSTEGALQLQLLNYLSGFRLGVAENAALTVEYSSAETNSYFGCVYVRTAKRVKAKVEPCEVAPAATNATLSVEEMERLTGQDGDKRNAVAVGNEIATP